MNGAEMVGPVSLLVALISIACPLKVLVHDLASKLAAQTLVSDARPATRLLSSWQSNRVILNRLDCPVRL